MPHGAASLSPSLLTEETEVQIGGAMQGPVGGRDAETPGQCSRHPVRPTRSFPQPPWSPTAGTEHSELGGRNKSCHSLSGACGSQAGEGLCSRFWLRLCPVVAVSPHELVWNSSQHCSLRAPAGEFQAAQRKLCFLFWPGPESDAASVSSAAFY